MLQPNINYLHSCRDLQKLIKVTLEEVIKPLRKELKSRDSNILKLEIEDAENKTFEFIALQISAIFNSSENRDELIKEFPNSEICFECLDIDEDTIVGFRLIRGISILELLDMEDEKVRKLLLLYANPEGKVESVIHGLDKIRGNIDLLDTSQLFRDDTRNLIKMVVELTAQKCDFANSETCGIFLSPDMKTRRKESSGMNSSDMESENSWIDRHFFEYDGDGPLTFQVSPERDSLSSPGYGDGGHSVRQTADYLNPPSTIAYNSLINPSQANKIGGLDHSAVAKALYPNEDALPPFLNVKDSLSVPNTPALKHNHHNDSSSSGTGAPSSTIPTPAPGDTPPASPNIGGKRSRVPGTPPPKLKLKLVNPLHKSRSHESNLAHRVTPDTTGSYQNTGPVPEPGKSIVGSTMENYFFPTEPNGNFSNTLSPKDVANVSNSRRSSCEERGLVQRPPPSPKRALDREEGDMYPSNHLIIHSGQMHRLEIESRLTSIASRCVICNHRRFFKIQNCVNCKIKVCKNKNCMSQVSLRFSCHGIYKPTDGSSDPKSSPNTSRKSSNNNTPQSMRPTHSSPGFNSQVVPGSDSTSVSSNNSSTPNSPHPTPNSDTPQSPRPKLSHTPIFEFPSICESSTDKYSPIQASTSNSYDHSKNVYERGLTVGNYNQSNNIDKDIHRLSSIDSQEESSGLLRTNSISVTLKEWDIPMESLEFGEILGIGSFGTVYRGKWHGEVAIKKLDLDDNEAEGKTRLDAFKREVATLHKTRHENLVLFMGACMKPPHLAIVTQLSKGETLYAQLHVRKQGINIARAITIASQVAKGMGYLHAKNIVHKDLKTKNIFLESNSKAVIGDFGLFDFTRLRKKTDSGNYLSIPSGWLCYLAPEIIRKLNIHSSASGPEHALPFTPYSDVYAFGTVWYELLTMEWPFKSKSPESIILLVGKGLKQTLNLVPGTKDFKEILLQCWTYSPDQRPEFTNLVKSLDKLPKLYRSPSYPVKSVAVSWSHENLVM